MIFEGSSELKIHSDENGLVVELGGNTATIPLNETLHLSAWVNHQITEIKTKQKQRLPRWRQLLTI